MRIGIIGFGRFGKLAARHLKADFYVVASSRTDRGAEARRMGVAFAPVEDAASQDIVILSVPISAMEATLKRIGPHLKAGATVIDTCSVKEVPVSLMQKHLPEHVRILGTHPLFGPDSAAKTLAGRKIVLCPVRIDERPIAAYLRKKGLEVIVATAEEHDRAIAHSLNFVHLIGRAMIELGVGPQDIDTVGYNALLKILNSVQNDSMELFRDMNKYNRFAAGIRKRLIRTLQGIDESL
ncbi:MAG: prephenate dehydrogenase/arogenate dehydrogenase family protein [archaeon]